LIDRRDQLYSVVQERDRPRLPLLQSFDWNLDVTLTTAYASFLVFFYLLFTLRSLSRCIEPLLFFQFRTSDNRNLTFEVNELKYFLFVYDKFFLRFQLKNSMNYVIIQHCFLKKWKKLMENKP